MMIAWVGDDAMPAVEGASYEWVTDAKYPFWRHVEDHEAALEVLRDAKMIT